MRHSVPLLAAALAGALPGAALAQQVTVTVDPTLAQQAGLDPAALEADLRTALQGTLHLEDTADWLASQANASFLSMKGMGADYASNPKLGVIGASLGTGIDSGGFRFGRGEQDLPSFGYAFQATALAGLNLGALAGSSEGFASRFTLYGNGMVLDTRGEVFDGSLYNVGGHLQIKLIRARRSAVVTWGGIDLTGGAERARYAITLTESLPVPVPGTDGAVSWDGVGTLDLGATTDSVPIELSTNVRVLVVTLFGGGGVDLSRGGSEADVGLTGDITATVDGQEVRLGTAEVRHGGRGEPVEVFPRVFAGAQVNVLAVKLYAHLNAGIDRGVGGHVGLRLAK